MITIYRSQSGLRIVQGECMDTMKGFVRSVVLDTDEPCGKLLEELCLCEAPQIQNQVVLEAAKLEVLCEA